MSAVAPDRGEGCARGLLELETAGEARFGEVLLRLTGAEHALVFAPAAEDRQRLAWSTPLPAEAAARGLDEGEGPLPPSGPGGGFRLHVGDLAPVPLAAAFPGARWALVGTEAARAATAVLFGRGHPPTAWIADPLLGAALLRRLADRADRADRGRGDSRVAAEALARLSHEFKTPLVSIKGYAELILDSRDATADDGVRDWARRIAAAANRLTSLYRKATSEARTETGWHCEPRPGDPLQWVRRGLEEARALVGERRLRWEWEAEAGLGPVALDPEAGRDLLLELLQNAARATPDGGEVRLRLVAETREGMPGVRLTVADTGVGIPAGGEGERLFDRFVTLDRVLGHHSGEFEFGAGGLGLGLPLVRGLARALGGEAWAEGRGRDPAGLPGCAFHVWLPACAQETPAGSAAERGLADGEGAGPLLVVDADPEGRRILELALGETHEVRSAATAAEALDLWSSSGSWAGCIVDPRLPDGGGVDLLRALRGSVVDAPIVVYTATAAPGEAEAWRVAGADSCVWKPSRTRVLVQRLRTLRARRNRR